MTKKLIFSRKVVAELQEIGEYIAKDDLQAALSFVDKLKKCCQEAADHPAIRQRRPELQKGIRSLT